jgi:2-methylcitrate dehydratase PrpD
MTSNDGADKRSQAPPIRITSILARYAAQSRYATLPHPVIAEARRAFLNWIGCVLGGCQEPTVQIATETVSDLGSAPRATIIGRGRRTDIANAAFVNCISSSVFAFDDAHLATVTHPSGPVGAAIFALSETRGVSGRDFLNAFVLGIDIQCRLSNVLVLSPAQFNVGFYVTGLTAPIGAAVAIGNLLRLDEQRMNWAIGLAASQSSGFRATHGTMTAHFRPGHAARSGVWAALLASKGFTGDDQALESAKGFVDVFSSGGDLERSVDGLGARYEIMANSYKPYPCGIVIHPILDACLEISKKIPRNEAFVSVRIRANPLALSLTNVRNPKTPLESQVSLYHWAAAALTHSKAGIAEMQQECIDDPVVARLRSDIVAVADDSLGRKQAVVEVTLNDGRTFRSHITDARGSTARPMSDDELDEKFRSQAEFVLPNEKVEQLLSLCRSVDTVADVGKEFGSLLNI